ncbi:Concanavalin A-like lectin/glucanases superfamily protein [Tangfeifania diversioriginum]|uniref:Concanavalin A-like lectin/glucanases superfamily protein n=1 Tax=Tangfeifania diversioriginum TaxID=1168035 RepID=A0A1M6A9P6_9BACT|nr:LamG-like jellyroll fold domain-containing protein [Tangfeifania diversioriginum]SHI33180.1 Concanavalin A-like lectin/glucanases superfamily protein [Tangfeifania diversioriginum]
MKTLNKIIVFALALIVLGACDQNYIDDLSKVEVGSDETAPAVTINSPADGYQIKVPEAVAPVTISFEATDDIELSTVSVKINGTEIQSYTDFKDYRRLVDELVYDNVTNGAHVLEITATDLDGKSTTASINFEKVSPYTPKYAGETFYMPFDGDYMELISFQTAAEVGNPGFAGEGVLGGNAYQGATDSYITFPFEDLKSDEFSATFWYKVDPSPDRAGILSIGAEPENRQQGFRLFREGGAESQQLKLNVGTGSGESWNDGGVLDATAGEWVHVTITITPTENVMYFDGVPVRTSAMEAPVDWTGCDDITIGAGGETFSYWNHLSDLSFIDELRFYNRALSGSEIQQIIFDDMPYEPKYDGEVFYMPFEGSNKDLVSDTEATEVGSPGFAEGKVGQAYAGAEESYLTFPTDDFLGDEFSAVFWMKINAEPNRAGILAAGPEDTDHAEYPEKQNDRTKGFRFFREDAAGNQRFKLNVGTGDGESWFDGGENADVDPSTGEWVHFAFSIAADHSTVYIDGEVVSEGDFGGIDWTGCDILSIGSGAPRFSEWGHLSDLSLMDELRLFNKALSQTEIQAIIDAEN